MTNEEAIKALKRIRDEAINNFIGDWQGYEAFDIALKALADRKTENSSEKPNNCDTCRNKGFEGREQPCLGCGCCGLYEPKDEPQERSE